MMPGLSPTKLMVEIRYDLTRSQKAANIFDMYYDKSGKGVKDIQYGEGRHNPKLWGIQAPKAKKKEIKNKTVSQISTNNLTT